jgi:ATP-dependent DNA helicase RecG
MEDQQLKEIIALGETQEVEFKQAWPPGEVISKVISSLANTSGGLLIIGVSDDKKVLGIKKQDLDKLQKIVTESNHNISPVPLISVETKNLYNHDILVVSVQRARDNTYHTFQGAIYIRIGSTTHRLEGQTQLDYLRHRQILSFDETFEESANIADIDIRKIEAYLNTRGLKDYFSNHTLEDFLVSNKLAIKDSKLRIKNSTILLFGKDPSFFHPQAEVKLVQFAGTEPVDIIDYKLIQTDIVTTIEDTLNFLRSKLSRKIIIKDAKRDEEYEYPLSVLRESVVNAITHRDYFSKDAVQISLFKDRIEITSPGTLPGELSKELFGTISVQRNPIVYRFLRDLGYVEGLGTGVPRIKSEMKRAGLPEPEFKFTESFIRITLKSKMKAATSESITLNFRQEKALEYLKTHRSLQAKDYLRINKVSYATAVNEINHLINLGFLKKVGEYRGAYYILIKKEDEPSA